MADNIQSDKLRLRSEAQWRVWIGHIRLAANNEDVWDYLDPELTGESVQQVPKAIDEPTPSSIRRGVQEEWDLTKEEYEKFTKQMNSYERKEAKRLRLLKVMGRMDSLITRSLATEFHCLIADETTPREKLIKLAKVFKPKKEVRTQTLRRAWRSMIKQPTREVNIDHWLTQWTNLYEEGKAAGVPDICYGVNYAIRDFLEAVQPVDDLFASNWLDKISTTKETTFPEVVSAYRARRAQQGLSAKKQPIKAAFATPNGQPEAKSGEKSGEKSYRTRCPCGRLKPYHRYNQCYYLVKSIRPEGWTELDDVKKRIPENLKQMSPKNQKLIQKLMGERDSAQFTASDDQKPPEIQMAMCAQDDSPDQETPEVVLYAPSPVGQKPREGDYHLMNSWIIDSGATCHICNDRNRFISF